MQNTCIQGLFHLNGAEAEYGFMRGLYKWKIIQKRQIFYLTVIHAEQAGRFFAIEKLSNGLMKEVGTQTAPAECWLDGQYIHTLIRKACYACQHVFAKQCEKTPLRTAYGPIYRGQAGRGNLVQKIQILIV